LAIHQRHYQASLTAAIREKLPATAWLLGQATFDDVARRYVCAHPPQRPCIAEYGEDFPAFLARHVGRSDLPYLESFAELEWHIGQVSIAIDRPPLSWSDIVEVGSDALVDARIALQPGVRLLHASWAIDHLITTYLTDSAPNTFVMATEDAFIEIRGARGAFHLQRLGPAAFGFRAALLTRCTLAQAAEAALERDPDFDAGQALAALVAAELVTDIAQALESTS
jgi:Putative DNA-binding domain